MASRSEQSILHTYFGRVRDTTRLINEAQSGVQLGYRVTAIGASREGFASEPAQETINGVEAWLVPIPATLHPLQILRQLWYLLIAHVPEQTTQVPADSNKVRSLLRVLIYNLWLLRIGQRHRPDIIHCHEIWAVPGSWLLSALTGAQFVYDIWEPDLFMETQARLLRAWQAWSVRRADLIIITAQRLTPKVEAANARAIVHIGNWKDAASYDPARATSTEVRRIRADLGLDRYAVVVSWIGFFFADRYPERILDAVADMPDVCLLMAGRGDFTTTIAQRADQHENIKWLGWLSREQVADYTLASDVIYACVPDAPKFHYFMPNKFSEGIVSKRVLLATRNVGELADILAEHDAGYLIDAVTVDDLQRALHDLKASHLRQKLAENAYALRDRYSWQRAETLLDDVYQSLLK